MAGYTKGPWSASCCDVTGVRPIGDSGVRFWRIRGAGVYRGDVCSVHSSEHIGGVAIAERNANARLIAAAPELLEALQSLEASGLLGRLESNASGNPEWEVVSKRVNAARDAIAKATGEE